MTGLQRVSRLAVVGLIDIGLVVIGVYGAAAFDHKGWLSFSVAALAIVTFFGFLQLGPVGSAEEQAPERVLRRAIAATAVLVYLVLVGLVAFFPLAGQPKAAPNPVTELLLTNFTAVVGTIVAFYFGSSAYLEARKKADKSSEAN